MNRLTERLRQCRAEGRLLLVGYLPAGWPDRRRHADRCRLALEVLHDPRAGSLTAHLVVDDDGVDLCLVGGRRGDDGQ